MELRATMRETLRREAAATLAASRSLEVVLPPGTITNLPLAARSGTPGSSASSSGSSAGGLRQQGGGSGSRRRGRDIFTRAGGFRVPVEGPVFGGEALSATAGGGGRPAGVGHAGGATLRVGGGSSAGVKLPAVPGATTPHGGKPGGAFEQRQVAVFITPAG